MSTPTDSPYSRKNPFPGKLVTNRLITGEGSEKETRHFEISLAGSGLSYEVGDALGVYASNDPKLVEEILHALGFSGEESVPRPDNQGPAPIRAALTSDYEIKTPGSKFLKAIVEKSDAAPTLKELLDPERKKELDLYLWGMEVIDFLLAHPSAKFTPEEFIATLRKITPRLYSIASSLKAHPEQVHLTIAVVRYESHGRQREGLASSFLADRVSQEKGVPLFFHVAKHFRLPEDDNTPIIMVGPGTGVAPFRAYLQERRFRGAKGKNWLFFGEQREKVNFFYKEEFEQLQAEGYLERFTTAFSRDQAHKIYVQTRMLEPDNAKAIWEWLQEGAHFYVCGDAARMAKDVDAALHTIIQEQGGKTPEEAAAYVEGLKKEKRYKRDVY